MTREEFVLELRKLNFKDDSIGGISGNEKLDILSSTINGSKMMVLISEGDKFLIELTYNGENIMTHSFHYTLNAVQLIHNGRFNDISDIKFSELSAKEQLEARSDINKKDMVNNPIHYGGANNVYEVVKVLEAWGLDRCFYLGSCIKYIQRAGKKDPNKYIEDLEKARWVLDRKINNLKKEKAISSAAINSTIDEARVFVEPLSKLR
jgi:Protein of unknwon function (DUF3310)